MDPPDPVEPSTNTNQSSDTAYAYPYQHLLDRFIAFMTMYQRRRTNRRPTRPLPTPPEPISSELSTEDWTDGYLKPISFSSASAHTPESQKPESASHYHEPNETPLLANGLTTIQ